jgi:hypothetical protein
MGKREDSPISSLRRSFSFNSKFWPSFLSYHRLKRARQEIKAQEEHREEKRRKISPDCGRREDGFPEMAEGPAPNLHSAVRTAQFSVIPCK